MSESEVDDMFDFDSMTDGNIRFREARAKDLVFNIVRSDIIRHKEKTSHCTEFNKKLHKDELKHASVVGVQPLLNAKANDHNTINTCIERVKVIANKVGDDHEWFVADQDIYATAQETKWMRGDKDIYFRMGDSTPQIYMACIGDHITGSEIPKLWIEAEILTAGEADKIIQGRDYKASL